MPEAMPAGRSASSRLRRRAWRAWYATRWRLWQRRQCRHTRVRRVAGIEVVVLPGVLDPAVFFSSEVLVDAIRAVVTPGASVLELGTGCGIGAIAAAQAGAGRVVATDVDPIAVRCAQANVLLHYLAERVEVRQGDLFAPVNGERFDLVAFNPPWLDAVPPDPDLEAALHATPDLAQHFAGELAGHIAPGGTAILVLSSEGDAGAWLSLFRPAAWGVSQVTARDRGSEVLTAWRLDPPG